MTDSSAVTLPTGELIAAGDRYGLRPEASKFPMMLVLSFVYPCNAECPHCPYTNSNIRDSYKDVPNMPASLEDALDNLKRDHEYLLKGDVFTEDLIETWIDYKMSREVSAVRLRPHPHEFAMYFDA